MSGISHGVQIQGRLPADFLHYLWPPEWNGAGSGLLVDVEYRAIPAIPEVDEFWISTRNESEPASRFALFTQREGFGLLVECLGQGLFRIAPDRIRIEWLPGGTGAAHYFFSYALPLWLELNGIPVLHAGAVSFEGRAVAFVGRSGAGKSTLCNALVRQGAAFVADDGLGLIEDDRGDWHCCPGPPLFRLWPSALDPVPGVEAADLARVHEHYEKRLLPLARKNTVTGVHALGVSRVYILERQESETNDITLISCAGGDALVRLVEFSMVHAAAEALGWTASRLQRLARLAERTSVKRLVYPSGEHHWERIKDAIAGDLERTGSNTL